ncbi:MAG: hypothetical protein ACK5A2_06220 [Bacteroidota bacterium]|jgi:hypothetical protein
MKAAKQKQQIAESINSASGSLVNGVATGAPGELIKRKVDKAIN